MDLPILVKCINNSIDYASSVEDLVQSVRNIVSDAIADELFVMNCAERAVENAEQCIRDGANYQPLHSEVSRNWRMAMFLWDVLSTNEPHQHNTWSVSGVIHNCLEVMLYKREGVDNELHQWHHFVAQQGKTGYLIPPCIHALGNPHPSIPTVTLHVFCDSEELERRALDTVWLGDNDPRRGMHDSRRRARRDLKAVMLLLKNLSTSPSENLLQRIFDIGDVAVCLEAYKQLVSINAEGALRSGYHLAEMITGSDRERFLRIHRRFHEAHRSH